MFQATTSAKPGLWCIVLAAGASRRLGQPKQLLRFRSKTLLRRALDVAASVSPLRTIVVIGAQAHRMRAHLQRTGTSARIVYNRHWAQGMGTSLRAGLKQLPPQARAALILLTDQPEISPRTIRKLLNAHRARPAFNIASMYENRLGVPAILPRHNWQRLRELDGDSGARDLLRDSAAAGRLISVPCPEASWDIDTPDDLAQLR